MTMYTKYLYGKLEVRARDCSHSGRCGAKNHTGTGSHDSYCKNCKTCKEGGCYLTTSCVEYAGLPDDCHELEVLRQFRDSYVAKQPDGNTIIAEYYHSAPIIVSRIQSSRERNSVLAALFEMVKEAVNLIEAGSYKLAFDLYSTTFKKLKNQYGT